MAIIGLLGFGFVTSWVFGREYMDHTIKDMLALPVSRTSIVMAKFLLIALWCILLSVIMLAAGIAVGFGLGVVEWELLMRSNYINHFFITAFLTILLITPVGFMASYGRGVILPIAFIIITLLLSQFITLTGLGPYFPWAIPGINTVAPGTEGMDLTTVSYIILAVTCLFGLFGTLTYWLTADQH